MSQRTLYVRLPDEGEMVEWLSLAADGALRSGRGALDGLVDEAQGAQLVVLLPAVRVTMASVVLPPMKRAQQRQSALYALEDQLVDDLDDLHAALGERGADGRLPLLVVNRSYLSGLLDLLASHHLRPDRVVVDALALPWQPDEWSLLWEDDGVRLRIDRDTGYGFEHHLWPQLWQRLLSEQADRLPQRVRLYDGRTEQDFPIEIEQLLPGVQVEYMGHMSGLRWLTGAKGGANDTINLLQGSFSRSEQWGQLLRPWRPAAILLLLWLVLQLTLAIVDLRTMRSEEAQLDQQMEALYRTTFPDAKKVVDARLQMEQRLAALKSGDGGFLLLTAKAAPALKSANAQLKGVRYQAGILDIDLTLVDMTSLDALRSALHASGLQVEIGNTTSQEGRVESRLTLRGGGE